jgi:tyrosine-protein kinase Etk/Wzc
MDNYFEQFDQDYQEKPINWREIFEKLIGNWKWFVFSAVVALIAGVIYGRMQQDVYELKSSVLIIDQTRSGQMNEMSVLKQLDAAGMGSRSTSMVNNEDQVLKSTVLMKRVVQRLELYTIYSHKRYLKTEEVYTGSPLYVHMDSLSLTRLKYPLKISFTPDENALVIEGNYHESTFQTKINQLPAIINTPAGVVYIKLRAKNNPALPVAATDNQQANEVKSYTSGTKLKKEDLPDDKIEVEINNPVFVAKSIIKGALSTEVGKMVDVIDLTLRTSNVQKGQDILNTLTALYNQDASEQNNMSANNTARFIDTRLRLLVDELSDVEKQVENYKQANNLTDIDEDAKVYLTKNNVYDQQQIELEMQQHLVKYVEDFIHNPANQYALIPNLGLTDVGLVGIIQKYNELIIGRDRIANGSSDKNPALITLNQQIGSTRKAIQNSIVIGRKGLQITDKDLTNQNKLMQSKIKSIPRKEREMLEIKRQQQVKASLYLFLLQKREEASLNMAVTVPKGRTLNTPDDATPVGPHRSMIVVIFLVIGLLIPAIIIYLLDLINTSIRSREDVEKKSGIPVITELGHNDNDSIIVDNTTNANPNSELFRLMRTKLQFTLDSPKEKVILITSTMSGEGKTFVSLNLALMLSLADKKVLLMGMDLRKPQLAKHLGIQKTDGITAYLSGQITSYKSMLYKPAEYPSLHVLPAGVIPPNPTELIMKDRFDQLIAELKDQYDYIIIDTAPVGAVSDTFLIDRVADLTLYVCRAGYTDIRNIDFVNRINHEKSLKRIFFVVNDVNLEANRYSYHRKYGYGYGYGYGKKHKNIDGNID